MKAVLWQLTLALAWWLRQGGAFPVPGGECGPQCGDVAVPFPFGLETNCARFADFLLNCTITEESGIQLQRGNLAIRKISVGDSTMVVSPPEAYDCYDQNGRPANNSGPLVIDLSSNPLYRLSHNIKLTVLGCNTFATVADREGNLWNGCISFCSDKDNFTEGTTCSGRGCCQASIPNELQTLDNVIINIASVNEDMSPSQFNRCGLAFVANDDISNWTLPSFKDVGKSGGLVLDWMVEPDVTCQKAKRNKSSYACGKNTDLVDFGNGPGYRCVCKPGYYGNPYNPKDGCKDIDGAKNQKDTHVMESARIHPGATHASASLECRAFVMAVAELLIGS